MSDTTWGRSLRDGATRAEPNHRGGVVEETLRALREHLGMEVAFVARVSKGKVVIQYADTGDAALLEVGQQFDAEATYCKRIIDGRLPFLIPDTSEVPATRHIAATRDMPIGSHISVPLVLSDGTIYGTFCALSREPHPELADRDLRTLQAFAVVAARQIEAELRLSNLRDGALERVREAIEDESLQIVLQPIFDLRLGHVIGFEALSRFPDERSPAEWFEEAELLGLGKQLELLALQAALQVPRLPPDVYLAVNVSPALLVDPELESALESACERAIVLEVTEHAIVTDYVVLRGARERLRSKVRLAVDDAGAGYAGLRHILDLHPDIIKLDETLTRKIDTDSPRAALAKSLCGFARRFGAEVIAEGIETAEQRQALERLGINRGQGNFLSPPMSVSDATELAWEQGPDLQPVTSKTE